MSAARRELYVYFRVSQTHWRDAADAVSAWQRALHVAHSGLITRVLRRPDTHDDAVTLMEIYACEQGAGAIDDALLADIERGAPAVRRWLIGERHCERFDALD